MPETRPFLENLALVLCVAAATTVVFRKLKQPVVLGYLLAGVLVGPHVPLPLFADHAVVERLAELGVILVMFSIGLELSLRKLGRVLPTAGLAGLIQVSAMTWLGYLAGRAFGWNPHESVFAGAVVAISSTMIVVRVFAEEKVAGRVADLALGILVVQDVAAILLLAVLTALTSGAGDPEDVIVPTTVRLVTFLVALVVAGFLVVPRTVRAVARLGSPETLLVLTVGVAFAFALVAAEVGYSVALGAFLAGSLVAESGHAKDVERMVRPLRDVFAAVFFVAIGMLVDPALAFEHAGAVAVLTAVVVLGQTFSVTLGAFLSGVDLRTSVQAGLGLTQIGEFSFILASVGVASGAVGAFLLPVAVSVSVVTAFTTPYLVRASESIALAVDRRLPHRLQTFVSLYGTWVRDLRAHRHAETPWARVRHLARLLALDAVVLVGLAVSTSLGVDTATDWLERTFGTPPFLARAAVVGAALAVAVPFLVGIARCARGLGAQLATLTLPPVAEGKLDLADAPRRALVVTLQLAVVLVVGVPLLALTQPFVPAPWGAVVFLATLAFLALAFWRRATDLHEHVTAGAEVVLEALARQVPTVRRPPTLEEVQPLLPGLGLIVPARLDPAWPSVGRTLAELNLRGKTGATVIAITREGKGVVVPSGHEALRPGDVLAMIGSSDAVRAAVDLLAGRLEPAAPDEAPEGPP